MTATTIEVGDIVRVVPDEAEVTYNNSDGRLDLKFVNSDVHVEYVPANKLVLVRKRTPAEPPVGTVLKYLSSFGGKEWDYIRTPSGWAALNSGVVGGSFCKWSDFTPARVRLYQAATTPPK